MSLKSWFKHAFAVDTNPEPPSEAELQLVERICREVVRRQMTIPAITFLEMARPLNYLGSQTMRFFEPIVSAVADAKDYQTFAKFLERRDAIDTICEQLGKIEQEAQKIEATSSSTNDESQK